MNARLYTITSKGLQPLVVKDYALGRTVRYTGDMANASGIGAIVAIRTATQWGPKSYDVALTVSCQPQGPQPVVQARLGVNSAAEEFTVSKAWVPASSVPG